MAATPLEFRIKPYRGGSATADGAVTPIVVVPTKVFLAKTDGSQVTPNALGYALSLVAGWLYTASVSEALVGIYYWYVEDADTNIIADGYLDVWANDTNTYRAVDLYDQAVTAKEIQKVPRASTPAAAGRPFRG